MSDGVALVAVGDARSALPTVVPKDTPITVPSQTKAIGVVIPPPDIRHIIDRTAKFVSENGRQFEAEIKSKGASSQSKFDFLTVGHVYNAYYEAKLKEQSGGGKGESSKDVLKPTGDTQAADGAAGDSEGPAPQAVTDETSGDKIIEKPKDLLYMVPVPDGVREQELDIIRLTAQYVARNGTSFLQGLSQKERTNPAFMFIKPNSSLFGLFTSLTDAYSRALMPPAGTIELLEKDANDRHSILQRCLQRQKWERQVAEEAQRAAAAAEKERNEMLSIDWHSFQVVASIEFQSDEDDDLPAPLSKKDIIAAGKAGNALLEDDGADEQQEADMQQTGEVAMDAEDAAFIEQADGQPAGAQPPNEPPPVPPPPLPPPSANKVQGTVLVSDEVDDENIKVVHNYQRSNVQIGADGSKLVASPITGELIKVQDMGEHMRIHLLDPKWKQQSDAMISKLKDSTQASDDEIARNLVSLADTRPDIFGSTQEEVSKAVSSTIAEASGPVSLRSQLQVIEQEIPDTQQIKQQNLLKQQQSNAAKAASIKPTPPIIPPVPPKQPPPLPPSATYASPQTGAQPSAVTQRSDNAGASAPQRLPPPSNAPPTGGTLHMPQAIRPGGISGQMSSVTPAKAPMAPRIPSSQQQPTPSNHTSRELHHAREPLATNQPDPKRQKLAFALEPEAQWLAQYSGPQRVCIACPAVEGNDNLQGQVLQVEVSSLGISVADLKQRIADNVGLASNKQKLSRAGAGFMLDTYTLAYYNLNSTVTVTLGVKERGGRKK